ncbi:N/A [soil metagenome]
MQQIINQYFDFDVMFGHGNFKYVIDGFWQTVQLSIISGILALIWGLVLALLRQLPGKIFAPVRILAIAYIDALRGIPLLLILLLVSGGLGALSTSAVDPGPIPSWLAIPNWFGKSDPFWYGVFAITLTYGAYMAEVYRAGIEAVPRGQTEAARSLGMSYGQSMRFVVVPQAVRKVIPPLLNDFIALTKDTALVSFIGLIEVTQAGSDIQSDTFNASALTLGAILFLVVTIPLARIVDWMIARDQRRSSRGAGNDGDDTPNAAV